MPLWEMGQAIFKDFVEQHILEPAVNFCESFQSPAICGCQRHPVSNRVERTDKPLNSIEISKNDLTPEFGSANCCSSQVENTQSAFDKSSFHLVPVGGRITGRVWISPRMCYDSMETKSSVVFEDHKVTQFYVGSERPALFFDDFEPVSITELGNGRQLSARVSNAKHNRVLSKSPRSVLSPRAPVLHRGAEAVDSETSNNAYNGSERPFAAASSPRLPGTVDSPNSKAEAEFERRCEAAAFLSREQLKVPPDQHSSSRIVLLLCVHGDRFFRLLGRSVADRRVFLFPRGCA